MSLRYSNEITAKLENIQPVYINKILDAKSFYNNNKECRYYMVEWNRTWESEESLIKLCSNFITDYWNKKTSLVNGPVQRSNQQIPLRILQQLSNQQNSTHLNADGNQHQMHNSKQRFISNNDINYTLKDPYLTSQLNSVPTNDSYYTLRHQLQESSLHQHLPSNQYLPTNNAIHPTVISEQTRNAEKSVLHTNSSKQTVVKEEKYGSSCSMQSSQSINDYTPTRSNNNSFMNNNNNSSNNGGGTNLEEAINNLSDSNLIAIGNGNTAIKISNVVSCNDMKEEINNEDYNLTNTNQDTYYIPTTNVIQNQTKHDDLLDINSANLFENIATSMDQYLLNQANTYNISNVNESVVGQYKNTTETSPLSFEVKAEFSDKLSESTKYDLEVPVKTEERVAKQPCCHETRKINAQTTTINTMLTDDMEIIIENHPSSSSIDEVDVMSTKVFNEHIKTETYNKFQKVSRNEVSISRKFSTVNQFDNVSDTNPCENVTLESEHVINVKNNAASECNNNTTESFDADNGNSTRRETVSNDEMVVDEVRGESTQNVNSDTIRSNENIDTIRSQDKGNETVASSDDEMFPVHDTENIKRTRRVEKNPCNDKNKISIFIGENTYERLFTIHGRIIPGKNKTSNTYQCRYCDKIFQLKLHLRNHITIHDPHRRFFCTTCDYATHFNKDLKRHVKKHDNVKIRQCHICGYSHVEPSKVKAHMRIHFQERPFKCDQCSFASKHQTALKIHVENIHQRVRRFQCEKCDKKFSTKVGLQNHIQVHTNERQFKCSYCTAAFNVDAALKRHQLIHTNERPYHCHICDLDFNQSNSLKRHIRIHTQEKPYKCKECDYACAQSASLKYHMRKHEKKGEEDNCTDTETSEEEEHDYPWEEYVTSDDVISSENDE